MRIPSAVVLLCVATTVGCSRTEDPSPTATERRPARSSEDSSDVPEDGDAIELSVDGADHVVTQGHAIRIAVELRGRAGASSAASVALSVRGLPRGLTSAPATVTTPRAFLEVRADDDAEQGRVHAQLDAVRRGRRVTKAFTLFVRGPAGALDTTFGKGGMYEEASDGSTAGALALGAQDSLFALRRCATTKVCVRRLTADGVSVATYGHSGVAWTGLDFPVVRDLVALRGEDGSLLVASEGIDSVGAGMAKLDPDGAPVASFGTGEFGAGTMPVDFQGALAGLSAGAKGAFFVGGTERVGADVWFGLRHFDAMGRPKKDFGDGGRVRLGLRTPWAGGSREVGGHAWGIGALDEQTHFVVGDGTLGGELYYGMCAVSNASGAPAPSFGVDGRQSYEFSLGRATPFWTVGRHVAVTDGGVRAFSVWQNETASTYYTLVAFGADGRPVVGFGKNGLSEPIPVDDEEGTPGAIAVDGQGRIVVVLTPTAFEDAMLVRFTKEGLFDTSFGKNGRVRIHGAREAIHADVAVQSDGRIVTLTTKGDAPKEHRMMLSRYWD